MLVEDDFQKYTNDLSFGVRLYRRAGEHGLRIPRSSFITRSKNNGGGGVSITMQNILNEKNQKAIKHNVPEQKVKGERTK